MHSWMEPFSPADRDKALAALAGELAEFSYDGLLQLAADLERHRVLRGTWEGCVISYRNGAAGSARRDRTGRRRNAFTVLWDTGRLTDEDVLAMVLAALQHRAVDARPATVNFA